MHQPPRLHQTSTKLGQPHIAMQSAEIVGNAFMGKSGDRQEKREQAHNCRLSLTAKQLIIITKYKERMENSLPQKETNNLFFFAATESLRGRGAGCRGSTGKVSKEVPGGWGGDAG